MIINEIFESIQGEGVHIGRLQTFVRLAGCNMDCSWCDTKKTHELGNDLPVDQVLAEIASIGNKSVCLTGGEPLLQLAEVTELVEKLKQQGHFVLVETNGSIYDEAVYEQADCMAVDMKPPSSGEKSDEGIISKLKPKDYVKIVICDLEDLEFAKKIIPKSATEVVLQPEHDSDKHAIAKKFIHDKINARLIPQAHKILGVR